MKDFKVGDTFEFTYKDQYLVGIITDIQSIFYMYETVVNLNIGGPGRSFFTKDSRVHMLAYVRGNIPKTIIKALI